MFRRHLTAGVALLILLAACGGDPEPVTAPTGTTSTTQVTESPSPTPSPTFSPDATPSPSPESTEEPDGTTQVTTYYVRSGPTNVFVEPVVIELDEPTVGVAAAAYTAAIEQDPADPGLSRVVPQGTRVLDVTIDDGVLTVDLSAELAEASGGSAQEQALRNQLAEIGLQFDTVDAVQVLVEGQPVSELWGHYDWSEPFVAEDFAVSPIVVLSPEWNAEVDGPAVSLEGTSNTFEATLELVLTDAEGLILEETFTTATCGTGCRGEWSHTFSGLEPGSYIVVARAPDPSGGAGPEPFATEVRFTVE